MPRVPPRATSARPRGRGWRGRRARTPEPGGRGSHAQCARTAARRPDDQSDRCEERRHAGGSPRPGAAAAAAVGFVVVVADLVDRLITVVVDAVATHLGKCGGDVIVRVVAVAGTLEHAVAVVVDLVGREAPETRGVET